MNTNGTSRIEWPTVALTAACYAAWFALVGLGAGMPALVWVVITGFVTALYWSIVHEAVHGHPTQSRLINHALVWLPLGWVYAHGRFSDGHLEHHATGALTDPFDDPESWYLAQHDWAATQPVAAMLLTFNNTLLGRLLIGPMVVLWRMLRDDTRQVLRGGEKAKSVAMAWFWHLPPVLALALIVGMITDVALWQFIAAAYIGVALILIRTFLEHQASENDGERTVIIESNGPMAWLFLYNSLHIVHHTRPGLAWYRLHGFYRQHRDQFIQINNGYVYPSYWAVFKKYFLVPKEAVRHPFVP